MHLWAAAMLLCSIALGAFVPLPGPTTDIWFQPTVDGSTVAGETHQALQVRSGGRIHRRRRLRCESGGNHVCIHERLERPFRQ